MANYLSPLSFRQFIDANGNPYSGARLFVYVSGSTTKVTTYKDEAGVSAHSNPILLNTRGEPADGSGSAFPIWHAGGASVKYVLAPSTDTDPPASPIATWDNIDGINDTSITIDQWITGPTPTYVSVTSFTVVGDQTSIFGVGRRIKTTNSAGTIYSTVTNSVFTSLTTITVINDSGSLDSGLSSVSYGLVTSSNTSLPAVNINGLDYIHQGTVRMSNKSLWTSEGASVASATNCNIWTTDGNTVRITGTTGISSWGTAPQAGAWKFVIFDDALTLTHDTTTNAIPGNTTITTAAGDSCIVYARGTGSFKIIQYTRYSGLPITTTTNIQTFNSSGIWYKPTGYGVNSQVKIQLWAGGGSGGAINSAIAGGGGGGGGAYTERWLTLSALGATETATIGVGGAAVTGNSSGNPGVNSSFGSLLLAYGGAGGGSGGGNGGGGGGGGGFVGTGSAGASGSGSGAGGTGGAPTYSTGTYGGGDGGNGAVSPTVGNGSVWGGGGGGGGSSTGDASVGGNSIYAGGGGGGASNTGSAGNGGTSLFGGAGGAGLSGSGSATSGTQPGGGGGGVRNGTSGAGAAGRCIVTVFS